MNDQPQYAVQGGRSYLYPYGGWLVTNQNGTSFDRFRSRTAAEHAANMLNRGIAVIDPHAIVGCKVIAR